MELNAIDLFCGCGGLSYGFERAGYNILLGIDNDKKALETFELNHKGSKSICGDITEVTYEKDIKPLIGDKKIDVIIGGPPCQGMSLSGPRKFDDPRNKLYLSYIRLVDEIRPRAFVIENVPGLVGLFGGQIKDSIISKFTEMGYSIQYSMNKGRAQDITKPCNTVGAHLAKVSLNSTDPVLLVNERYRRFTPREVARIQSFPENFELVGSEAAQYRALGNAIPPVMFWYVAKTVRENLECADR